MFSLFILKVLIIGIWQWMSINTFKEERKRLEQWFHLFPSWRSKQNPRNFLYKNLRALLIFIVKKAMTLLSKYSKIVTKSSELQTSNSKRSSKRKNLVWLIDYKMRKIRLATMIATVAQWKEQVTFSLQQIQKHANQLKLSIRCLTTISLQW